MNVSRTIAIGAVALLLVGSSGAALAHGAANHVMGTAREVGEDRLEVETNGGSVSIGIGENTRFRDKGGAPAERGDLRAGDRVVVDLPKDGKVAEQIRFAHPEGEASSGDKDRPAESQDDGGGHSGHDHDAH